MSSDPANKWNARYAFSTQTHGTPSVVLTQGEKWLPAHPTVDQQATQHRLLALDLACGRAANSLWLAQRGFNVEAWDISESVISQNKQRHTTDHIGYEVRDVVSNPPAAKSFDVIVVSRFLDRSLCVSIANALKPNGVLFYQTFTHGLSNASFMLKPNELLTLFNGLHVLEFHEPEVGPSGRAEALFVAKAS